jgi:hypothetical protein
LLCSLGIYSLFAKRLDNFFCKMPRGKPTRIERAEVQTERKTRKVYVVEKRGKARNYLVTNLSLNADPRKSRRNQVLICGVKLSSKVLFELESMFRKKHGKLRKDLVHRLLVFVNLNIVLFLGKFLTTPHFHGAPGNVQRFPKVTSHVVRSSCGRSAQYLRRIRGYDAHPA